MRANGDASLCRLSGEIAADLRNDRPVTLGTCADPPDCEIRPQPRCPRGLREAGSRVVPPGGLKALNKRHTLIIGGHINVAPLLLGTRGGSQIEKYRLVWCFRREPHVSLTLWEGTLAAHSPTPRSVVVSGRTVCTVRLRYILILLPVLFIPPVLLEERLCLGQATERANFTFLVHHLPHYCYKARAVMGDDLDTYRWPARITDPPQLTLR